MKGAAMFFLGVFTLLFFTSFVFAEEKGETEYIFTLKENVDDISLASAEDIDVVSEKLNIFRADFETFQRMKELGMIEHAEEDISVELMGEETNESYNDEYFGSQWYFQAHNFEYAKKVLGKGDGVRVAIIDSGVTLQDDFNTDKIEKGYNYINPSKTGNEISDLDNATMKSHGTRVASIICSQENNEKGIVGIAPNVTIVPLIIYQDSKAPLSNVITAIEEAVSVYNCSVINMSLGTTIESELLKKAVDYADESGVILVASAGNDGKVRKRYPAAYDNVISVGSVDGNNNVCSFSQRNENVDIMAAGNELTLINVNGGYDSGQKGTSFSSPIISGFAALLKEKYPDIDNSSFLKILKAGSLDIETLGHDIYSGFGVFDAMESIKFLESDKRVFISPIYENDGNFNIKVFDNGIVNGEADNGEDCLIIAVYDTSGRLIHFDRTKFSVGDEFYWKSFNYDLDGVGEIKAFVYDSIENMIPLGKLRVAFGG